MLEMKYKGQDKIYPVKFEKKGENIVSVQGTFPVMGQGFYLSRTGCMDEWDYTAFKTIFKQNENEVLFSSDGTIYAEPPKPEPEPEPVEPSIEEIKEQKVLQMNEVQQEIIKKGLDIVLSSGQKEHFTMTEHDQTSLMGLQSQVIQGKESIPWHTSDQEEHCKYYSNTDMQMIVKSAMEFVTFNVTYFRDLRIYIRSLETKESIATVVYGMTIPNEYQSKPLVDMYASMTNE